MKKFLPHLAFIFSIIWLVIGIEQQFNSPFHHEWQIFFPAPLLIIFFLWKNNYFTRNKS